MKKTSEFHSLNASKCDLKHVMMKVEIRKNYQKRKDIFYLKRTKKKNRTNKSNLGEYFYLYINST